MNTYIALAAIGSASAVGFIVGAVLSHSKSHETVENHKQWLAWANGEAVRHHNNWLKACDELRTIKHQRSETVRKGNLTRYAKQRAAVMTKAAELRGE